MGRTHRRASRLVAIAIAGLLVVAVAVPPRQSHDFWSYAAYGRLVGVHHVSPYEHAPSEYPHDPFVTRSRLHSHSSGTRRAARGHSRSSACTPPSCSG